MRFTTPALAVLVWMIVASAFAQGPPCAPLSDGFDPYKPSDLAIVRQYGGTAVSQAPLSALLQLDPYVPMQAELLRQLGSAIPWWPVAGFYGYPLPLRPPDCAAVVEPAPVAANPPRPLTEFSELLAALEREQGPSLAVAANRSGAGQKSVPADTARGRTLGVSIHYAGRTWISDGPAIAVNADEFVRVGESAGFPVFRRAGAKGDVIYVPSIRGLVAPFRAVR